MVQIQQNTDNFKPIYHVLTFNWYYSHWVIPPSPFYCDILHTVIGNGHHSWLTNFSCFQFILMYSKGHLHDNQNITNTTYNKSKYSDSEECWAPLHYCYWYLTLTNETEVLNINIDMHDHVPIAYILLFIFITILITYFIFSIWV